MVEFGEIIKYSLLLQKYGFNNFDSINICKVITMCAGDTERNLGVATRVSDLPITRDHY